VRRARPFPRHPEREEAWLGCGDLPGLVLADRGRKRQVEWRSLMPVWQSIPNRDDGVAAQARESTALRGSSGRGGAGEALSWEHGYAGRVLALFTHEQLVFFPPLWAVASGRPRRIPCLGYSHTFLLQTHTSLVHTALIFPCFGRGSTHVHCSEGGRGPKTIRR
jgi:hypothetical protein